MNDSKKCFKCSAVKPLSGFYKHKMMADGHLNKCKECTRADTKKNREDNADYYNEYDRDRALRPDRVDARLKYAQTLAGKAAAREGRKNWLDKNTVKRAAHIIVGNSVRYGVLKKPASCQSCGAEDQRLQGHHDDYAKPLEVRWICSRCHNAWHKKNGPGANG